jgi:predicted nucleotide-binding protein
MAKKQEIEVVRAASKRVYLKQSDVPALTLDEALRVPLAILDHYEGKPTTPLHVAKALNLDPKGSQLKLVTGAAIAFGLIEGGAQANAITVTELARRILRSKKEGDDLLAKREAVLLPRVFGQFLQQYDGNALPRADIAHNVLEDMGVPRDKAKEVLERLESCARSVGFIEEIKDKNYIILHGSADQPPTPAETDQDATGKKEDEPSEKPKPTAPTATLPPVTPRGPTPQAGTQLAVAIADDIRRRRVFITHGKNRGLVDPIKKLLEFGELEPVISVERQSVSKPVPEKVMDDMRGCGAAIIHVDAEESIIDKDGKEHVLLNPNVLIEIGAAMAFYGRRFILLVREGIKVPSNLQGLYEVRYAGDNLDANSTIMLLNAIKDIKNYALPTEMEETEV